MDFSTRAVPTLAAFVKANNSSIHPQGHRILVCTGKSDWDAALNNIDRDAAILFIQRTSAVLPSIHENREGSVIADVGEYMLCHAILSRLLEVSKSGRINRSKMFQLLEAASEDARSMIESAAFRIPCIEQVI